MDTIAGFFNISANGLLTIKFSKLPRLIYSHMLSPTTQWSTLSVPRVTTSISHKYINTLLSSAYSPSFCLTGDDKSQSWCPELVQLAKSLLADSGYFNDNLSYAGEGPELIHLIVQRANFSHEDRLDDESVPSLLKWCPMSAQIPHGADRATVQKAAQQGNRPCISALRCKQCGCEKVSWYKQLWREKKTKFVQKRMCLQTKI